MPVVYDKGGVGIPRGWTQDKADPANVKSNGGSLDLGLGQLTADNTSGGGTLVTETTNWASFVGAVVDTPGNGNRQTLTWDTLTGGDSSFADNTVIGDFSKINFIKDGVYEVSVWVEMDYNPPGFPVMPSVLTAYMEVYTQGTADAENGLTFPLDPSATVPSGLVVLPAFYAEIGDTLVVDVRHRNAVNLPFHIELGWISRIGVG